MISFGDAATRTPDQRSQDHARDGEAGHSRPRRAFPSCHGARCWPRRSRPTRSERGPCCPRATAPTPLEHMMRPFQCTTCSGRGFEGDVFDVCRLCGSPVKFYLDEDEIYLRSRDREEPARERRRMAARRGQPAPLFPPSPPSPPLAGAEKWFTVDEAAEVLGLHRDKVTSLIGEGRLTACNVGTETRPRYRIPTSAFTTLGSKKESIVTRPSARRGEEEMLYPSDGSRS
jgi:excisionase family DNA binding protein